MIEQDNPIIEHEGLGDIPRTDTLRTGVIYHAPVPARTDIPHTDVTLPSPITYHRVILGAMTREGNTLAEITEQSASGEQQTCILHVPAGLPGEHVTIAVEAPPPARARRHRRHWKPRPPRVEISEVHQPSALRTPAVCPVFGTCGGCQLQHMHYSAQLQWKQSIVRQVLQDIGKFDDPPLLEAVPCDDPWHYRNHMRFSVNRSGQPGLTARGSHRVLPLVSCPIAHERINQGLSVLSQVANAQPQVVIRCGAVSGQMLIQPHPTPEVAQQLLAAGLDLRSDTMEEVLADEPFRIRPSSFFQTNTAQAEKMVQMVLAGLLNDFAPAPFPTAPDTHKGCHYMSCESQGEALRMGQCEQGPPPMAMEQGSSMIDPDHRRPRGSPRHPTQPPPLLGTTVAFPRLSREKSTRESQGGMDQLPFTVADAYCGVGTFALLLARHVAKVIAIEESTSAIKDAQWNLHNVSNVELLKGKTEDLLPALAAQLDGLVLDPPRAGCQQVVLDALVQHPVRRIVYVSCDPATLARDLNILCHQHPTYHLRSVQPLDMFPQTAHIECVAVLERKES